MKVTVRQVEFGSDPNRVLNNMRRQMNNNFRRDMFLALFKKRLRELDGGKDE